MFQTPEYDNKKGKEDKKENLNTFKFRLHKEKIYITNLRNDKGRLRNSDVALK